ncbi:lytic transglycosylase domain-containing protein [Bradyrhizobium sp. 200]|nr:lytic transglycosylase domain-containing protein [Bradyrhizobium sp. 200]
MANARNAPGRPRRRRKSALPLTAASSMACFRFIRFAAFLTGVLLPTVLPSDAMAGGESTASGSRSSRASPVESFAPFIAEASRRFAIPPHWIRAVMQRESAGDEQAASPKGALGLMQIMPRTWVELSVRYGLGIDPLDPRDNIMAGAAYLREMLDRFGAPGFLAAYNAGPERYEQHLATGRPLPAEAQAYVAALAPILDPDPRNGGTSIGSRIVPWQQAPLFPLQLESVSADRQSPSTLLLKSSSQTQSAASPSVLKPRAEGMFVRRSNEMRSR